MKKGRKNTSILITVIFMILLVAAVLVAFFQVRKNRNKANGPQNLTEVEKLLNQDLETNYPGNAREVVKFYNRILKCFYNENLTEEELKGLAGQARIVFDTELLKRNPVDSYMENLKAEIAEYKKAKRTISNITIQDYDEVRFETKGEYRTASLLSNYWLREDTEPIKTCMRYYLREDEDGFWRILFWEMSEGESGEE